MTTTELRSLHAKLARELLARAFRPSDERRPLVGAEVEVIPIDAVTRGPVAIARTTGVLNALAVRHGWSVEPSAKGTPLYLLADGGRLTFEPGGQLEYSSAAFESASTLLRAVRTMLSSLQEAAASHQIELLAVGLDPLTPLSEAPRQISGERYERMESYFATVGSAGATMMRQTASLQICVDTGGSPLVRWRLLNALAPLVTAAFANSPLAAGEPAGSPSARACVWRQLDRTRTGILPGAQAAEEYAALAMAAPDMMHPRPDGSYASFAQLVAERGFHDAQWRAQLSTMFTEVRPRGYFEVRSCDAIAPGWHAAPLALICGIALHPPTARMALELFGEPSTDLLERASRSGLADARVAALARDACQLAIDGSRALGERFMSGDDLAVAEEYFSRYTAVGASLATDLIGTLQPAAA